MIDINKGITYPTNFKAWGSHVGLKKRKKDLTIIHSQDPCQFVGYYTQNCVKAAPVIWNMNIMDSHNPVKSIVINSGNANACTGKQGMKDTEAMAMEVAKELGDNQKEVLVASTGVIGVQLPIKKVLDGIGQVSKELKQSNEADVNAAEGILTTDTFIKQGAIEVKVGENKTIKIGGMAKGSGMIHPNMATMLSFITTDAQISRSTLYTMMEEIVKETYNMISVDGDTSTNDMVLMLANGASGETILPFTKEYELFKNALRLLNTHLATSIVKDGEGAGKFLQVQVSGMKSLAEARKMAKSVIGSSLVKTALFGEDANWGRVLCAMGYSGVDFDTKGVAIRFMSKVGEIEVFTKGEPVSFSEEKALKVLKEKDITMEIQLSEGEKECTAWGCDLSYDYVRINGEYRS